MITDTVERSTEKYADKKITVFEALASELVPTGPNMSNQSTPSAGDADDQ
ncbi:hypothetical protein ACN24L_00175 [Streptomyces microflavus]